MWVRIVEDDGCASTLRRRGQVVTRKRRDRHRNAPSVAQGTAESPGQRCGPTLSEERGLRLVAVSQQLEHRALGPPGMTIADNRA